MILTTVMKFAVFSAVLAVHGLVHATSQDYPKLVQWHRTESELFVSEPNILEGIDFVNVSQVPGTASPKEEIFLTERGVPGGKLDCLDTTTKTQPRLKFMRRDLPGLFLCAKPIYVIPVIEVEIDRFFNVTLDFLKLDKKIGIPQFNPLPPGMSVEVGPSGIISISGILRGTAGSVTLRFDFQRSMKSGEPKTPRYKIKVLIHVRSNTATPEMKPIEFRIDPNQVGSRITENQKQIRLLKCAAKITSLQPWSFHGLSPGSELSEKSTLRAHAQLPDDFCVPDPSSIEDSCEDFVITKIVFNGTQCDKPSNRESIELDTQQDQVPEMSSSEEDPQLESVVKTEDLERKTSEVSTPAPVSTASPQVRSTTAATRSRTSERPVHGASVETVASTEKTEVSDPNTIEIGKPGILPESNPSVVSQSGTLDNSLEDLKLRTAMYGFLGLTAIVVFVIFLFLFSKLELCKKKSGYDPVYMARLSDESAKFA